MSYYFAIIGTEDSPLFEYEFGTSKQGGDGNAHFGGSSSEAGVAASSARHMNQFVVHAALDVVEEIQWATSQLYLRQVDRFFSSYVSCFVTPSNNKFLLLHQPSTPGPGTTTRSSAAIGANPTSPQTEEAIRQFFVEVYESWTKTVMNPFYRLNMEVQSPVFRAKVAAAGRKYL